MEYSNSFLAPSSGFRVNWRPTGRWSDGLDKFWLSEGVGKGDWTKQALDREWWRSLEDKFAGTKD